MGGIRWCKNYHTSHEGPIGSKCQQFDGVDLQVISDSQASTGQASGSTVASEQARSVADHVTVVKDSSTVTSTGISSNQELILAELQKISHQRFSKLEEQASQDISVLSDLVNHVHSNQQTSVSRHVISTCSWSCTSQAGPSVMTATNSQSNSHSNSFTNHGFSGNAQFVCYATNVDRCGNIPKGTATEGTTPSLQY